MGYMGSIQGHVVVSWQSDGIAEPGGGSWSVPLKVTKATRLDLLPLHTDLYCDHSLATAATCSSAALIAADFSSTDLLTDLRIMLLTCPTKITQQQCMVRVLTSSW